MRRPGAERVSAQRESEVVDPAGAPEHVILTAASYCPTGAIEVADAETGEILFPR